MAARATFYYDFTSPYAYLTVERIDDLIPDAEWKPFAYPFLLDRVGRLQEVLARDTAGILENVRPRAADRGLPPVEPPPGWPFEIWSLAPLRAALVADDQGRLKQFTTAAFRKVFVESTPLTEVDTLRDVARDAGLDPDQVADGVQRPEIKQRLKDQTEEAIARGVPGIPTVAIGDQLFHGDDRLEEAAAAAG